MELSNKYQYKIGFLSIICNKWLIIKVHQSQLSVFHLLSLNKTKHYNPISDCIDLFSLGVKFKNMSN